MRKFITSIVAIMALLATGLATAVLTATPAQAVAGCTSKVINKYDTWVNDFKYGSVFTPNEWDIRGTATANYWYCPNGTNVAKVKIKSTDFCWTILNSAPPIFEGMKFDAVYGDNNHITNPGERYVQGGGLQRCENQPVPDSEQEWLQVTANPGWSVSSFIVLFGEPDAERSFRVAGIPIPSTRKQIVPSQDPNTGSWFN